jgi:hypothetical protein
MKNNREEISTYYKGMPSVFEKISQEEIYGPQISEILTEKALKLVLSDIGVGKAVCEDASGKRFFIKHSNDTEEAMYVNVLPAIEKQKLPFRVLQLPKLVTIVRKSFDQDGSLKQQGFIITKYVDGSRFNDRWDEINTLSCGGKGIKLDIATRVVALVTDLSLIDTSLLNMFALSTFDFSKWKKQNLPFLSEILTKRKLIDQKYINKVLSILSSRGLFENSQMLLTNGDFYPRNLIELPNGKITIVDWEGRQDYDFVDQKENLVQRVVDQRTTFVNFVENHIAFFCIHMWGNPDFQRKFIQGASRIFDFTAENLQAAILIKSLEQALIWPDDLARIQIGISMKTLDIGFVRDLMK